MSGSETEMKKLEKQQFEVGTNVEPTKNPEKDTRTKHELIYQILKSCEKKTNLINILKRVGLDLSEWEKYNFLIENGYIKEEKWGSLVFYHLKPRGSWYIKSFDRFRHNIDDPVIFPDENIKLKEISEPEQKPSYLVYHEKLLTILKNLSQIDFRPIKNALRKLDGYIPRQGQHFIQIDSNLAITFKRGKKIVGLDIERKNTDSAGYSVIYSLNYSPPEVLAALGEETIDKVMKTLEGLEKLPEHVKNKRSKTETPISSPVTKDVYKKVTPTAISTEREPFADDKILYGAAEFLNGKMLAVRQYQKADVLRFLSLFVQQEWTDKSLPAPSANYLFMRLKAAGILKQYESTNGFYLNI